MNTVFNNFWLPIKNFNKQILVAGTLCVVIYIFLKLGSFNKEISVYRTDNNLDENILVQKLRQNSLLTKDLKIDESYSRWPSFLNVDSLEKQKYSFREVCLRSKNATLTIDNIEKILNKWHKSNEDDCFLYYKLFSLIYQVEFKQNKLVLENELAVKVKNMLGNNEELFKTVYNQVISIFKD